MNVSTCPTSSSLITIILASYSKSESLTITNIITLFDVTNYAMALFDLTGEISLYKNRIHIYSSYNYFMNTMTLVQTGINNGDLIYVDSNQSVQRSSNMEFQIPSVISSVPSQKKPVQWEGITLEQVIRHNPDPHCLMTVMLDERNHGNLKKELCHRNLDLFKLLEALDVKDAATVWKQEIQKKNLSVALSFALKCNKEQTMKERLHINPMDAEANYYFGEKIRKNNVDNQYQLMMDHFPESMCRVLMLYINVEVNGRNIQAFVDSGAQSTIMSNTYAEQCGLLHLLDDRFAGVAIGVGTGKILGRIHMVSIKINEHFFPITITVMDRNSGLCDIKVDFLFGLDMLRRHRCHIDLEKNVLVFGLDKNEYMETSFLNEKDLEKCKGGTKGVNNDKENNLLEKIDK